MKRVLCCGLMMVLLMGVMPVRASASEMETIYFEDGSYSTIELTTYGTRASGSKSGSKTYNHYDSNGSKVWKVVLTGSFTYTGSSATCTSADMSATIYDSAWSVYNISDSKSGNVARGAATVAKELLGVTVAKKTANLTITCDANGNLS